MIMAQSKVPGQKAQSNANGLVKHEYGRESNNRMHYTLYATHYTLYTTHYTLHLYTAQYTLYNIIPSPAPDKQEMRCSERKQFHDTRYSKTRGNKGGEGDTTRHNIHVFFHNHWPFLSLWMMRL